MKVICTITLQFTKEKKISWESNFDETIVSAIEKNGIYAKALTNVIIDSAIKPMPIIERFDRGLKTKIKIFEDCTIEFDNKSLSGYEIVGMLDKLLFDIKMKSTMKLISQRNASARPPAQSGLIRPKVNHS